MELSKGLSRNFVASIIDKVIQILSQFIHLFLMARLLTRGDYGLWGIALSLFVFVHFINIAVETVLYKNHRQLQESELPLFATFIRFSFFKLILFYVAALVLWLFFYHHPDRGSEFIWPLLSMATIMGGESLMSVYQTFFIVKLRQDLVARITFFRAITSIILLLGLVVFPSLLYLYIKELLLLLVTIMLYQKFLFSKFSYSLKMMINICGDWRHFFLCLKRYSLWVHLVGVTTNFIYKADIFFLSLFTSNSLVGSYTIALNSANVANILPGILGQQVSVALGHIEDQKRSFALTHFFIRSSILLSFITLLAFALFGKIYLQVMSGEDDVSNMYFYLLCIATGLVMIKTFASPLVAYLNIKGEVRRLFWFVNFPLLIVSAFSYFLAAYFWQDYGVALANITNSFIWVVLLLVEVKRSGFCWNGFMSFAEERQLWKKWRTHVNV